MACQPNSVRREPVAFVGEKPQLAEDQERDEELERIVGERIDKWRLTGLTS